MSITHLPCVFLKATIPCPYALTSYSLISIDHTCTICTPWGTHVPWYHPNSRLFLILLDPSVVATTRWNSTHSLLTLAKFSVGYLVVVIIRELDKEPLLHCSSIYINYMWSILQQYLLALMSMPLSHVLLLRPPYHIHVPWRHTL